jgi:hypothetical protein
MIVSFAQSMRRADVAPNCPVKNRVYQLAVAIVPLL